MACCSPGSATVTPATGRSACIRANVDRYLLDAHRAGQVHDVLVALSAAD